MKIGLVRRGYSATGGAEAYLLRLAAGLAAAGHEPILVTSSHWPAAAWPFGGITRLPGSTPTAFAQAFLRIAGQLDVTLSLDRTPGCDVFRAGDGVHAAWLKRRARFEPAWRAFLRRWNPKHGALQILERSVFAKSRFIIANSRMVAREIMEYFDVPDERLRVIPNGIGKALPLGDRQAARKKLGIPAGAFCVLFVGSGWERKGLRFAIRAMGQLPRESLLLVAGRGPAVPAGDRVCFLGPTRDLGTLFSAADVFTLPTLYDPFSNACLEALAAGLPVVTTTANGFSEIIIPGLHGNIVEPGDVDALATALGNWSDHGAEETASECRDLASRYSIERNTLATLRVLEEAAASL